MHKYVDKSQQCPGCGSADIHGGRVSTGSDRHCSLCGRRLSTIRFVRPEPLTGDDPRFFKKPRKCPACNSGNLAMIIYGIPDFALEGLWNSLDKGEVVLAGNYTGEDYPLWQCLDCDHHLYSVSFP